MTDIDRGTQDTRHYAIPFSALDALQREGRVDLGNVILELDAAVEDGECGVVGRD